MTAGQREPLARRAGMLLALFLMSTLFLAGRGEFFRSDGLREYRVGEAIFLRGGIDLPPRRALYGTARHALGPDGRAYSLFGLGAPVQYAAAAAADRVHAVLTGRPLPRKGKPPRFFATAANLPVVALTGVTLFFLLVDLGVAVPAAVAAALLAVFGTMQAVYATLSYNMPLANLFLLAGSLFLFRACRGWRARDALAAGLLLSAGLLTRITTAIFLPFLAVHALLAARAAGLRRSLAPAAAFSAALAAGFAGLAWHNIRRFGGVFATGYSGDNVAYGFDTPLLESLPALLASPDRSILLFSPVLLLALAGVPALLRARRAEGLTLVLMALANLVFFAKNRNWATLFAAWGPRFQLPVVALLGVPLGFALASLRGSGRALRAAAGALCAAAVALQLVVLAGGFAPSGKAIWNVAGSQPVQAVRGALARFSDGVQRGDLVFWWAGPWGADPLLRPLAWAALATAVVTGALLVRELARPAAASRETDGTA